MLSSSLIYSDDDRLCSDTVRDIQLGHLHFGSKEETKKSYTPSAVTNYNSPSSLSLCYNLYNTIAS